MASTSGVRGCARAAGADPVDRPPRWPDAGAGNAQAARAALGGGPRLFAKRDDAIPFGFGGNKVRKLEFAGAAAVAAAADTLVTVGGIQSNHARATAATATRLGLRCLIIANGQRPLKLTGNALLNDLLGADIEYIASRDERAPAMHAALERLRRDGHAPFEVPLGASTPLGALGFARAVGELVAQDMIPDVIVHASSSGGTQAGIVAGCTLWGLSTRVIGVSADDPAASIQATIRSIIAGAGALLGLDGDAFADVRPIVVDDGFIGDGYGVPSSASTEAAQRLAARTEALFVDHAYTAKALGALIAAVRVEPVQGQRVRVVLARRPGRTSRVTAMPQREKTLLPRRLTLAGALAVVVGSTIGSGIFRSPAAIASRVPTSGALMGVWVAGGLLALCGALTLAEITTALPETGGIYVIVREGWGRLPAFLFGWAEVVIIRAAALGAVATTFAEYLLRTLGHDPRVAPYDTTVHRIAAVAIVVLAAVNIVGVRSSALLLEVATVVKVGALLLIALGAVWLAPVLMHTAAAPAALPSIGPSAIGLALVAVLWAYDGWADLSFVAGEVIAPDRTLPRALIGGTLAVLGILLRRNLARFSPTLPCCRLARSRRRDSSQRMSPTGWSATGVSSSSASRSSSPR